MTITVGQDNLKTRRTLKAGGKEYDYFSLPAAAEQLGDLSRLPYSLKILLENLLRYEDGRSVTIEDIKAIGLWLNDRSSNTEVAYRPARVLMQDFTGVPAVVDLAAMRAAMAASGKKAEKINPLCAVDLVIDHSVMVDYYGTADALAKNVTREYERNGERYEFLRWGSSAFRNFRVVPPGTGICHQVNLEYLAQTVWIDEDSTSGRQVAFPDTCVGTDSHTTMVNGLGVLGWGVGGIEAEAAMLGQPVSMLIPEVIGVRLMGRMRAGTTATDLVLTLTQALRKKGVVNKFVEYFGPGLEALSIEDRATIANMAPEYGATCGIFPVDRKTVDYLTATGRDPHRVELVEAYAKAQGMWRDTNSPDPVFSDVLELDLDTIEPSLAGPRRPQDRVALTKAAAAFDAELPHFNVDAASRVKHVVVKGAPYTLTHGDVVIAAITSCTNTSNPSVLIAAGLLARKARAKGLMSKPWVKTSFAPGSQVVTDYMLASGLQADMDALGFNLVGYGCTTCIGNSGPVPEAIAAAITEGDLVAAAVLSGNRNFEGRVNPNCRANYLASPPLVVAYALAGTMTLDMATQPLGNDPAGNPVFLKDIWPTSDEIADVLRKSLSPEMFRRRYADVFKGQEAWQKIAVGTDLTYRWSDTSTYVKLPPLFQNMPEIPAPVAGISGARLLALFGDSITTDHISPAGDIKASSPAGKYLVAQGVQPIDFNSYGARRGNHEVMMRGTFANIRIRNELMGGAEGGNTRHSPSGETMPIYDAAMRYQKDGVPLVVIAGKEYGTGSSRDWAAKGTKLLGVRTVIAESFERIHRSNLVGMGVLPLEFTEGQTRADLKLTGDEVFAIEGLTGNLSPRQSMVLKVTRPDGKIESYTLRSRIDTLDEIDYFQNGGILPYVLRALAKAA